MQFLSLLAQAVLFYILLIIGSAVAIWIGPGFHTVNGQMVMLFVLVAGVPGVFKMVWGRGR